VEIKIRTEEANSWGSIKLLTNLSNPAVVDRRLEVKPKVVEINVGVERNPAVLNSLCKPPVVERRFSDDRKPAVPNSLCKPPVVERRLSEDKKPAVPNSL